MKLSHLKIPTRLSMLISIGGLGLYGSSHITYAHAAFIRTSGYNTNQLMG